MGLSSIGVDSGYKMLAIFLVYKLPSGELANSDLADFVNIQYFVAPARARDLPTGLAGFKYYLEKIHPFDVWKAT